MFSIALLSCYESCLFIYLDEPFEFCKSRNAVNYTKVTETLTITSPDYPNIQYSINKSCTIQVALQQVPLQQVVLHILHQSTVKPADCTLDYSIEDTNGNMLTNRQEINQRDDTQCTIIVDILLTEGQDGVVLYLPGGTRAGFSFTFTGKFVVTFISMTDNQMKFQGISTVKM